MTGSHELLFDTGCLIDIYHGRNRIRPHFEALLAGSLTAYVSVLSEAELWRGLRAGEVTRHEALLSRFIVVPLVSDAARLAGSWMQQHGHAGLGWMDALICATASTARLPLLTRDQQLSAVLAGRLPFELYR